MRTLLAALLLVSSLPASAAALQPLVEVGRVPFEPPFEEQGSRRAAVLFHLEEPVGYGASGDHVFAFDARTGADLGRLYLAPTATSNHATWQLKMLGRRILACSYTTDALALIDIDEPSAPKLLEFAPGRWDDPSVVTGLDDGLFVLRHGYYGLDIVATEPFRNVAAIPHVLPSGLFDWATASAAAGAAPVLAVVERTTATPQRRALAVYDVAGGIPVLRFWREESALIRSILVDRAGEVLVAILDAYDPARRTWVETIDARTGATLASWDVASGVGGALAEGGGRQLLLVDGTGFDVVDLEDPGDPRPVGRIDTRPWYSGDRSRITPSDVDPVVFVADGIEREVLAVDPRTATVIARLPVDDGIPFGVALQEVPDGARRGAVIVLHSAGDRVIVRGGLSHLDLAELTDPATPRVTGRFLRNAPGRVDEVRALGGRHVVVYEIDRNSLALVDLSESRVAQVTGASALLGKFGIYDAPTLRTAGRIALVAGPRGWERFALARGRLEPLDARIIPRDAWQSVEAAELTPAGTVIALGWRYENGTLAYDLETTGLDGRTGRIPRVYARLLGSAVSPVGELLAVTRPEFWGEMGVDVYDVSDPSSPSLLWTLPSDVSDAVFDPTGTRLLVSGPHFGESFQVQVLDARTGAPVGPPSPDIDKFAYHGFGAQWAAGGAWRAIYWKWNWVGWENALVDLSGPAPTLLRIYYYDGSFPEFAPRDGGGWYEVRRDPWNECAVLVVGGPGGETAETDVVPGDHWEITAVRRGFVVTARKEGAELGVSLWRDPSLTGSSLPFPGGDE